MKQVMIHPTAEVHTTKIGPLTKIWQHVVVLEGARIGEAVNLCAHCFVENEVTIGNRVTIKSGVYLWDGIHLEDDVFVGPNVSFTNDKFPRSRQYPEKYLQTYVQKGASIGAGAIILPGIRIGEGAMVGAGAIVTKSVPPYAIVVGSPARIVGYVENGNSASFQQSSLEVINGEAKKVIEVGVGAVKIIQMKRVQDIRGELAVGDFIQDIPFTPKRFFFVFNVPSVETRGEHAHYKCEQFLICVKGSCAVVVDDGRNRKEILLNSPDKGIYLPTLVWGIQYKYSTDAVLLVFASEGYDQADYIRDYKVFTSIVDHG